MAFIGGEIKNIRQFLLARKTLVFIIFIILPLAYLFLVYYFYVFLAETPSLEQNKKIFINQKLYNRVMENFRQRELNFSEEASKTYIDPFGR